MACLGGVATTLNPVQDSIQDLARRLSITGTKYLVTIPFLAVQAFSSGTLKGIRFVIVIGEAQGCESISALLSDDGAAFPKTVKINPKEDVVSMPFSSGTTGISKGVMLTHFNLIASLCISTKQRTPPNMPVVPTVLNVLPFYHTYGLTLIMGFYPYVGAKVVLLARFEPQSFLQAIQDYKVCFALRLQI